MFTKLKNSWFLIKTLITTMKELIISITFTLINPKKKLKEIQLC